MTKPTRFPFPHLLMPIVLLAALPAPLLALWPAGVGAAPPAANVWQVGNVVNLSRGTQIRQGPGFDYCYHTTVPVDNWAVKVINGPLTADGRHWFDTSRAAAGDPSGGTGWVNIEQVDQHPGVSDRDNPCSPGTTQGGTHTIDGGGTDPLTRLTTWWHSQPLAVQLAILVVAVVLLPLTSRLQAIGSHRLVAFARAILWGIILGGGLDLLRPQWEPWWHSLPLDQLGRLDLPLVLLFLPLLGWGFGYIAAAAGIALALGLVVVVIVLIILYFYYLAALLGTVYRG